MASQSEALRRVPRRRKGKGSGKLTEVLLYTLDFPPEVERSHRQDFLNFGEPLPEPMVNPPKLRPGLALYLNAWYELDGERVREDYEYIRRSDAFDYCHDYELTWTQTLDLWYYMRKMDRAFFEWYKKKMPKQKSPPHHAPRHRKR